MPGFPDRIVPKDEAAAAILRTRTLTKLYSTRGKPEGAWLDALHRALDVAVAAAYGWPDDIADDEVLARLLALNHAREPALSMPDGHARALVLLRAGAHLYGTAIPASDLDAKSVMLPAARDILLQRVQVTTVDSRVREPGEHLAAGETDIETHSLQRYLALLASNQPLAIEMLFAPDAFMLAPPDPLWREVQAIGPALLTRRAGMFARYARRQADQYGVKGERAAASRRALSVLTQAEASHGTQARLTVIEAELVALTEATPPTALVDVTVQENRTVRHLEVCGRKAPFSATIHAARMMTARLVASYGDRTAEAERADGVDWKALAYAVRVGREAIELFTTGRLHFPLACAPHLLAIKLGQVPHAAVIAEIDAMLAYVERAAAMSTVPDEPDVIAAETLVCRAHRAQVLEAIASARCRQMA